MAHSAARIRRMGRPPGTAQNLALVHVRMPQALLDRIDAARFDSDAGMDRSQMVRVLLEEALSKRGY